MITIKQSTFDFISALIDNNNRNWFNDNKPSYDDAKENIDEFAAAVLAKVKLIDPSINPDLTAKKCVMRIYRDIRFSKDKTPYKNNFGIGISPNGKGGNEPGYYIQIQPNNNFIAGGLWMPESNQLKAIRQEIDYNTQEFLEIINSKGFKTYFKELDQEHQLKTTPKDYDSTHQYIDLLKLKSFTVTHHLKNEDLLNSNAVDKVVEIIKEIYPLTVFLKQAINPI
jgi:uncharacterized protein (TIGR02453 family)